MSGLAAELSAEFGAGVAARLTALERAAVGLRAPREQAAIRVELLEMARMWRGLLEAHCPAGGLGRCPRCRGWWGPRRWPCPVWTAAHTVLGALARPETAPGAPARHALRVGAGRHRPGRVDERPPSRPAGAPDRPGYPAVMSLPRVVGR